MCECFVFGFDCYLFGHFLLLTMAKTAIHRLLSLFVCKRDANVMLIWILAYAPQHNLSHFYDLLTLCLAAFSTRHFRRWRYIGTAVMVDTRYCSMFYAFLVSAEQTKYGALSLYKYVRFNKYEPERVNECSHV